MSITGKIQKGDGENFKKLVKSLDKAVVFLESQGGNVDEAIMIGSEIAYKALSTQVSSKKACHSACALIWLSGNKRYMSSESVIGFHTVYTVDKKQKPQISSSGNAIVGAYLNFLGMNLDTIEYVTTAKPEDIMLITPEIASGLNLCIYLLEKMQ